MLEGLAFEISIIEKKQQRLVVGKAEIDSAELKISESKAPVEVVSFITESELLLANKLLLALIRHWEKIKEIIIFLESYT